MKDQYAGDINDYRKYGLLRALTAHSGLKLGVCWMLTAPDGRTDGKHTAYLSNASTWRGYDPELFDAMLPIAGPAALSGARAVASIERSGVLAGALFWSEIVPDDSRGREKYFEGVRARSDGAEVLFFDPDNGLEVKSTGHGTRGSGKYLYWSQVGEFYQRGHSLVIYQHFPRIERSGYVALLRERLAQETGAGFIAACITKHVVFFVVARPEHEKQINAGLGVVASKWKGQIEAVFSGGKAEEFAGIG